MDRWNIGLSLHQASTSHPDAVACRTLSPDGKEVIEEDRMLQLRRERPHDYGYVHLSGWIIGCILTVCSRTLWWAQITWRELYERVISLSLWLSCVAGLRSGDRLGVLGNNNAEYLQLMYACAEVGAVFVPFNTRWSLEELSHAAADSDISLVALPDVQFITLARELVKGLPSAPRIVARSTPKHPPRTMGGQLLEQSWELLPSGLSHELGGEGVRTAEGAYPYFDGMSDLADISLTREEICYKHVVDVYDDNSQGRALPGQHVLDGLFCIVYTSGTTGRPKGVALSHLSQVMQAMAKCIHVGFSAATTFLSVVPLFHVGGISTSLAVTMVSGCHVFLPRFTAASAREAIQRGLVDTLVLVPTMLHMILQARNRVASGQGESSPSESSMRSVKTILVGGQPLTYRLAMSARHHMPHANIVQTYACSEAGSSMTFATCPALTTPSPAEGGLALELVRGKAAVNVEVRVVQRDQNGDGAVREAGPGLIGEIETRGPHVMSCYWGRPELTKDAFRPGGWLRTGDLGRMEERSGYLTVVGRAKDVIKTGGENVHASEVESVLLKHAWVGEAAAYGEEDDLLGEKIVASVVLCGVAQELSRPRPVACDEVRRILDEFCRRHLSHYKRPQRFEFLPALPRNSSGKLLRHQLRACL